MQFCWGKVSGCWGVRTEKLLAAGALLNNLNQSRLELLDRGDVVGEETHLSGLGGEVDLDDVLRGVDLLQLSHLSAIYSFSPSQSLLISNACACPCCRFQFPNPPRLSFRHKPGIAQSAPHPSHPPHLIGKLDSHTW